MRLSHLLLPAISLLSPLSLAVSSPASQPVSADLLYWPLNAPQPSVLARISYDPTSLKSDVVSYTPPSAIAPDSEDDTQSLVRVGVYTSIPTNPKQWVGTLTSLSSLAAGGDHKPTLRLHLGPSHEIYQVSLMPSSASKAPSPESVPNIELVPSEEGPRPHLNRPIVLSPDGKNPEEVPEKTLFQKYWWVFLIVTFLVMGGGGGEGGR